MWRRATGPAIALLTMLWVSSPAYASQVYVVRAGDTLWRISHHLGVRPADLAARNHLALTDKIHPGLRLTVPEASPSVEDSVAESPRVAGAERAADPSHASLETRPVVPSRLSASTSAAVQVAMRLVGAPYRWSGMGNGGFDCSGLVAHVFSAIGRVLPHSSFAQYEVGTTVSRQALGPGDLVFFQTYGAGASHVGIYIGASQFVHASYSRGVILSSIEEPYFRDRFIGARRL
jgi:cell wall-associated NlpC family hydrolase